MLIGDADNASRTTAGKADGDAACKPTSWLPHLAAIHSLRASQLELKVGWLCASPAIPQQAKPNHLQGSNTILQRGEGLCNSASAQMSAASPHKPDGNPQKMGQIDSKAVQSLTASRRRERLPPGRHHSQLSCQWGRWVLG